MAEKSFSQQLGIGVASLTFGAALSIFVYSAATGSANTLQAWMLFATSFLLMLRFWFRYTELFVQFSPSESFWQFLFDFMVSFFGILAVFFVGSIQAWALIGAAAMIASTVRCGLSWKKVDGKAMKALKRTIIGSAGMFVIFMLVYGASTFIEHAALSVAVFIIVLAFVIFSSRKK
ncbi:hypothetical protein HYZ41_03645 [archaeon]|nr:hypothetical protein [archaeon]